MAPASFPHYHRIFLQLRERILRGDYLPGEKVPGEAELAALFGVSRITTKRALNELEDAGFVLREQGRGTIVAKLGPGSPSLDGTLESLEASNRMIGRSDVRLLDFSMVTPPPAVARALGVDHGEDVHRITRLRLVDGQPFCHVTAYVPPFIGETMSAEDLTAHMLVELIERAGVVVERAEQSVSATLADAETAALLGVVDGAPLLRVSRTVFAAGDVAVEHFTALFRPDLYHISMSLSARAGRSADEGGDESAFQITA